MASQVRNGEINMTWLWIILAFVGGSVFGVATMCCFIIAGKEERSLEKLNTDNADNG